MFNKYSSYCYIAADLQNSCDDKILVDLQRLYTMTDYNEIDKYLTRVFGEVKGQKVFKYNNGIQVIVAKENNTIMVGAVQNKKEIFAKGWEYIEPETDKK